MQNYTRKLVINNLHYVHVCYNYYALLDVYNNQYFEISMQAVKIVIGPDNLALPLEPEGRKYIPERLVKLQLCQNTVDSILSLRSNEKSSCEIRYEDH